MLNFGSHPDTKSVSGVRTPDTDSRYGLQIGPDLPWRRWIMDSLPTGHFAYWTVHLLFGHFAHWTVRRTGHFAYETFCLKYTSPTGQELSSRRSVPWANCPVTVEVCALRVLLFLLSWMLWSVYSTFVFVVNKRIFSSYDDMPRYLELYNMN